MTDKLRHRKSARFWLLVLLCAAGVGCSSTSRSRFRVAEGSRSVASIGDRPLTTTVGASGSQVVADLPEAEPYRDPQARISGRVVDAQGRAISGAVVRLADGMSKAGRDVQTVTDASGGFTLGNLRPGSSYQLLAEADFGDRTGPLFGRTEADTTEHGVQIRLADAGEQANSSPPSRSRTRSPRTRSISERLDDHLTTASPSAINSEDVGPAAEPAATSPTSGSDWSNPAGTKSDRPSATDSGLSWQRPGLESDSRSRPAPGTRPDPSAPPVIDTDIDDPLDLNFDPGPSSRRPVSSRRDAEVNPLPPALPARQRSVDINNESQTRPISRINSSSRAKLIVPAPMDDVAVGNSNFPADPTFADVGRETEPLPASIENRGSLLAMPSLVNESESGAIATAQVPRRLELDGVSDRTNPPPDFPPLNPQSVATASNPTSSTPGDSVFEPNPGGQSLPIESPAPTPTSSDPSANYNPFALVADVPVSTAQVASGPVLANQADIPPLPDRSGALKSMDEVFSTAAPVPEADEVKPTNPPVAKKWGEVAGIAAGAGATAGSAGAASSRTNFNRSGGFLAKRSRAIVPTAQPDAPALCQFNPQTGQLVDFQLPDLDGRAVRFQDLDADYVLFDFWGTWCKPCTDSIPHLIELQKKYGPNTLKIVGVACEKTSPDRRKAIVAEAAQRLGINYSVLLASMDGTCPVQRDFQIQFYPTMILVDRRGKVLFRAEGATERNMYRLDQALAATQEPTRTARR